MVFHWSQGESKLLLLLLFTSFSHWRYLIVSHWSLNDSKFTQVSRTPISILSDFISTVICIVSICSTISISLSPLRKLLRTVLSSSVLIIFTVTYMFHDFLVLLYFSLFSFSFRFHNYSTPLRVFQTSIS